MSEDNEEVDTTSCCASCGVAEIDDIELTDCTDCNLVKYCSVNCQRDHRSHHEEECKKRAADLRDKLLFKRPEGSHLGDCPICCLPIPLDINKSTLFWCCSKLVCNGCICANMEREKEMRLLPSCSFCRELLPESKEEANKLTMKRVEANDPNAMWLQGVEEYKMGDYRSAFEYFTKATTGGCAQAHKELAVMYSKGHGVERDEGKLIHHLEEAAIGGHPHARYNLGIHEGNNNNNPERAVKHFIIAAALGEADSIKELMKAFRSEVISKEELNVVLRAHQDALNAMKSPQRKIAEGIVSKYS